MKKEDTQDYICDDRGVLENVRRIRSMTDEEFDAYVKEEQRKNKENSRSG